MVQSGRPAVASPVTVAREDELALIERASREALGGTPRVLLVGGEAGIGKSRLVADAAGRLAEQGFLVLTGGCVAIGERIPYLPVVEVLRGLVRDAPTAARDSVIGPSRRELAVLLPELDPSRSGSPGSDARPPPSAAGAPQGPPETAAGLARLRLFEGLLNVVERLAADRPTCIVVEDLQWADEASLALLGYLARSLRRGRLLLLVTVRADEATGPVLEALVSLERGANVERIELGPLSREAVGAVAAAVLGHRPSGELVTRLHELSGGNPFFAEELLASGAGEGPAGPWEAEDATAGPAATEPDERLSPRLRDVLRARVAPLPEAALALLRTMSVAGRSVDAPLLARAAGLSPEAHEDALRAVLDHQLIVRARTEAGRGYRFRHELLRTFVSRDVLPTEAARLHTLIADALEADPSAHVSAGELAAHRDAAGDVTRAFRAHLRAAADAERAYAFEAGFRHLERALALRDRIAGSEIADATDRVGLMERVATAAGRAGHLERAVEITRSILASSPDGPETRFESLRSALRWHLWLLGRTDEAVAEAELVLARPTAAVPARWRANALSHLAGLRMMGGDQAAARRHATRAIRVARSAGSWEEEALARGVLGWCLAVSGRLEEGVTQIRSVWEATFAQQSEHLTGRALAHAQLAGVLEYAGRLEEAAAAGDEGAAWARSRGLSRTFGAGAEASEARSLYLLGRWREAGEVLARALDRGGVGPGWAAILAAAALLAVGAGMDAEAAAAVRLAEEASTAATGPAGWLAAANAELALWQARPSEALGHLARAAGSAGMPLPSLGGARDGLSAGPALGPAPALSPPDSSLPWGLWLAAWAVADLAAIEHASAGTGGMSGPAIELVSGLVRRQERGRQRAGAWRPELLAARAELLRARGAEGARVARAWAATAEASADRPYLEAFARWRLAELLAATRGRRAEAQRELQAASAIAEKLGATRLGRGIQSLAERARLELQKTIEERVPADRLAAEPSPFGLSPRELEVLALLSEGATNAEIAGRLFISPRTASVHVSHILGKLGVSGRVEAAALALRAGLVTSQPAARPDGRPGGGTREGS